MDRFQLRDNILTIEKQTAHLNIESLRFHHTNRPVFEVKLEQILF